MDVRLQDGNPTTPIRVANIPTRTSHMAASINQQPTPSRARADLAEANPVRERSPYRERSPRRQPSGTAVCNKCRGTGHFSSESPGKRRQDRRPGMVTINAIVEDDETDSGPGNYQVGLAQDPSTSPPLARHPIFILNKTYRLYTVVLCLGRIHDHMMAMHPTLDTGAGLNLIRMESLPKNWETFSSKDDRPPHVVDASGNPLPI